ncbi:MAG: hypothetical protein JWQ85_1302 [Mucilaginibacter sp.]|nr:hypothetical protein [Mucilaginibacter sp.]
MFALTDDDHNKIICGNICYIKKIVIIAWNLNHFITGMSVLIIKSDESIIASNKLIKASLFSSSVHCAYYACVQLMLHILRSHFGKTELQITAEGKEGAKNENGYHKWLQNIIYIEFIRIDGDGTDASKFNAKIKSLSTARAKADYSVKNIIDRDALLAYDFSVQANSLLKKHFQL